MLSKNTAELKNTPSNKCLKSKVYTSTVADGTNGTSSTGSDIFVRCRMLLTSREEHEDVHVVVGMLFQVLKTVPGMAGGADVYREEKGIAQKR